VKSKKKHFPIRDANGQYVAGPIGDWIDGGRIAFTIPPGGESVLWAVFEPVAPGSVLEVSLPGIFPFEDVPVTEGPGTLLEPGTAGSTPTCALAGGIAAAGKAAGLEGALKELQAEVTPQQIKIDLSADVLFDFDKAELKPAAEEKLQRVLTVVNSRPGSQVAIDGHTDVRGDAAYNQSLSERRAASVRAWLGGHGIEPARITAAGAGESRPLRTGDTEADHQANRRVEIRIRN
jgi:outer membrane protein OmpA-like peptidoglycan-associated protein